MILARGRYLVFAFFLILASGVFTALPAAAASVSVVDAGITYTAYDAAVGDGATVTSFSGSGAVTIPDTIDIGGTDYDVVAIGPSVFRNTGVTAVTIGNKVTSIGSYAFYDNQIVSPNLGNSVVSIGDGAFRTNQLTSLTIPDTVVSIGAHAFNDNQIATLDLGSNVVSIAAGVFRGNQLTEVTFPASIESIGELAFVENAGLQSVVFAGPAPTVTELVSGSRTFPANVPAAVISYPWSEDVANGGGFSAPTWQGYTSAAIRGEFTVTFDSNGHGSTPPAAQTVLEGEPAAAPTPAPTDPDWAFTGWFTDSDGTDSFNFADPIRTREEIIEVGYGVSGVVRV